MRILNTREKLANIIDQGRGFIYNDFGGQNPKMCPVHAASCRWVRTMLNVEAGSLGVKKLWCESIGELVDEIERLGKVYALCGSEPEFRRLLNNEGKTISTRPLQTVASEMVESNSKSDASSGNFHVMARQGQTNAASTKVQNVIDDTLIRGVVRGTPRTYGDSKNDDIWRTEIGNGDWSGIRKEPLRTPVHLSFDFRVNPRSPRYRGNGSHSGPDIDTMVIGALDGLVCQRTERPTMKMIEHRGLCRLVTASKTIVDSDELTGFTLQIRQGDIVPVASLQENAAFSFCVTRDRLADRTVPLKDRRKVAVQQAAESANDSKFRVPRGSRVHISLAFANGLTRNPLSMDWLEAVIDGLGASRVGDRRFFDGPPTSDFGYDDSVVYGLTCCHVEGHPMDVGLRVACFLLPDAGPA